MTQQTRDVIVVGASAGGVEAVLTLASQLPADFAASLFIAIHMAAGYGSRLPELLSQRGPLRAVHPVDGEICSPGRIYVAPPDMHLQLRGRYVSVTRGPKENGHRPSVDALFRSAAASFGPRAIGVVLTGNLDCGTAGLMSIKARGGLAIAQDPSDAQATSMPMSAVANVNVDHVVRLSELGQLLARLTQEPATPMVPQLSGKLLELEGEHLGAPAPMVCPTCQGILTETQIGGFHSFRCHVGHAFSMGAVVMAQTESVERALWSAVRALEESAALAGRLAQTSPGGLGQRFEEKEQEHRQQADTIKHLLLSQSGLSVNDAAAVLPITDEERGEKAASVDRGGPQTAEG
jgi:two-component system chemotaxis response regulator CheB